VHPVCFLFNDAPARRDDAFFVRRDLCQDLRLDIAETVLALRGENLGNCRFGDLLYDLVAERGGGVEVVSVRRASENGVMMLLEK
jgi:hypothetical protein